MISNNSLNARDSHSYQIIRIQFNWIVYSNVAAVCHYSVNGKSSNKFSGSPFVTSVVIKTKISDVQETCYFMNSTHTQIHSGSHTRNLSNNIFNLKFTNFRKKQFEFRNYCGNLNEIISSGEDSGKKNKSCFRESENAPHFTT